MDIFCYSCLALLIYFDIFDALMHILITNN